MDYLRRWYRSLIYRPFKSADEMWRKRSKFGEWNEFWGRSIFASDDRGYNPPFLGNPFSERNMKSEWKELESDAYEYPTEESRVQPDATFEFMYSMVEDRVPKDAVVLDIGCNTGYQLENFRKKGFTNLWGIDPMSFAVQYAKENRPHLNIVEGFFGPPKNDVICDLMVWFGSIFRVPYGDRVWDAIDRCSTKYVLMVMQESGDDFNRDPHVGLAKRGFICIEKRCVTADGFRPIGMEDTDGPMIVLGDRDKGTHTDRNYFSFFLFRRIEPRPPAPRQQHGMG
jgi:SAM-dependent methyltransferase